MAFHPHVLEVKDRLQKSGDARLKTMCTLTEPKETTYLQDYENMWQSLFRAEKETDNGLDNKWAESFLDAVESAIDLPPYFYINGRDRKELIDKIQEHTKALKKIYEYHRFNQDIIANDGQFFHGFSSYDENGAEIKDNGKPPKVSIIDALEFFAERAEDEINESAHKGKSGKNVKAIRFIRLLAERNVERYERPLNAAVKTAVLALYGIEYNENDISTLLNRGRNKIVVGENF